jgi:hypothetical protein
MENTRINLLKKLNPLFPEGKGVEIGVFNGEFSKQILNYWNGTLYMVDVWRGLGGEYDDISNQNNHLDAYRKTMENISGLEDRGIMIRSTSKEASNIFPDESLDFIFIDANHAYDFVVEDIKLWFPKLKKGGIFSGHDYLDIDWYNDPVYHPNGKDKYIYVGEGEYVGIFGVNPAVDEFCLNNGYDLNVTKDDSFFQSWWIFK